MVLTYAIAVTLAFSVLYAITFSVLAYFLLKQNQLIRGYNSIRDAVVDINTVQKSNESKAWHVTYVAYVDHDRRNEGVPMQERLLFGQQFIIGSQTLEVKSDEQHVMSPTMFKDMLFKSLANDSIQQIEFVSAVPLRECDIIADNIYRENRAKFAFHDAPQPTQGNN